MTWICCFYVSNVERQFVNEDLSFPTSLVEFTWKQGYQPFLCFMNRFRRHPAQPSSIQTQHAKLLLKEHISRALSTSEGQNNGNGNRQKLKKTKNHFFILILNRFRSYQQHHRVSKLITSRCLFTNMVPGPWAPQKVRIMGTETARRPKRLDSAFEK